MFALAGRLDGKGIGAALEQEGGVGEGVVIEPQRAGDLRLPLEQAAVVQQLPLSTLRILSGVQRRLLDGVEGRRSSTPLRSAQGAYDWVPDVEVQVALPAALLAALAPDAIALPGQAELELHPHLGLAEGDQLIVATGARLTPQRPRDRVEQGRFAVAVVAGQAGQVNAGEVEALLLAVAHEVVEAEFEWNHRKSVSGIRDQEPGVKRRIPS